MSISTEDAKRYDERFGVKKNPENAFEKIHDFSLKDRDDNLFTQHDYFEHLYYENDSIQKAKEQVINFVINNQRYILLHSYGRNGKSSFLNFLEHRVVEFQENGINPSFEFFDFEGNTNLSSSLKDSFQNSTHFFLNKFLFKENSFDFISSRSQIIKDLNTWLDENPIRNPNFDSNKTYEYNNLFSQFRFKIGHCVETFCEKHDFTQHNQHRENLKKKISDILNQLEPREAGELFAYVLLLYILKNKVFFEGNFLHQYRNSSTRRKIIIVLDNIDDILNNEAEDIATNYTYYICKFLTLFESLSPKIEKLLPGFDIRTDISIIYSFRTANYVNAMKISKEDSASIKNRHTELFHSAPKIKITSVKDSHEIINKRFRFYKDLVKKLNVPINPKYAFFEHLLKSLQHASLYSTTDSQENYKDLINIFRLWNGNREVMFNNYFYEYLRNLDPIPNLHSPVISYLIKGTYLNIFLKPFIENKIESTLSDTIQLFFASFDENIRRERCSLQRILFTIILNRLQDIEKKLREITCSQDLHDKGISLFDLIETIKAIDTKNNQAYELEEIESLLNSIFFEEIDEWGHLLTCTKSTRGTSEKGTKIQGKYLDFTDEFDKYRTYQNKETLPTKKSRIKTDLSKIKFYYNDSCFYLITHVHRHFEYYAAALGFDKPLILHYHYSINKNASYSFEFEKIIRDVLNKVSQICVSTLKFYENNFLDKFPPLKYTNSEYALNGKFYFDDMISKQHTYIEQFRLYLTLFHKFSDDANTDRKIKESLNCKLVKFIKKYHALFFTCFRKLSEMRPDILEDHPLIKSYDAFVELERIATEIEDANCKIFTKSISTKNMLVSATIK